LAIAHTQLDKNLREIPMKHFEPALPSQVERPINRWNMNRSGKIILFCLSLTILSLASGLALQGQGNAQDPGPRTGPAGAGQPIPGLDGAQLSYFQDGEDRFTEVDGVTDSGAGGKGLGPTFNSNSCVSCHASPAIGGSSPAVNPQIQVANADGATNTIPDFITLNGPVREVRFKFAVAPNGRITETPDGGVHSVFTIQGRIDAPGCQLSQPDFDRLERQGNLSFRIPTPIFGGGLIESIDESTILANQANEFSGRRFMGVSGHPNHSGNDGSITRFGWKAQNKSLMVFGAEAYNVEMGVTNEMFPNERGYPPTPVPQSCLFNQTPEDGTNFDSSATTGVSSDAVAFAIFMRLLDQPQPSCTGSNCSASIQNGRHLFTDVAKCAICHTPTMKTGKAYIPALSGVDANLFSDLLVHNMGRGLSDGVTQGDAGPDEFRTAPLWGLGQRIFFLHDGRTSDLMQAIEAHASPGSEANFVIRIFNGLSPNQKQDILNFLRSL
jgi:CxxC motif-containing protein (DUF1111 family)